MKSTWALIKKEFRDYFISPIAYISLILFLFATTGVFAAKALFEYNEASLRRLFETLPLIFSLFVPALTMRSWAQERETGTMELLCTFSITKFQLILAKFVSTLMFVVVALLFTSPIVFTVSRLGNPDWGVVGASYLATVLLASVYILLGQLVSINTRNQIVSVIVSAAISFGLYALGQENVLRFFNGELAGIELRTILSIVSTNSHFANICKGVLDTRDLVYYFSLVVLFFVLIYKSFEDITKEGK